MREKPLEVYLHSLLLKRGFLNILLKNMMTLATESDVNNTCYAVDFFCRQISDNYEKKIIKACRSQVFASHLIPIINR